MCRIQNIAGILRDMKTNVFIDEKYNYSIAFMKAYFSFCVVCCHFWGNDGGEGIVALAMRGMCGIAVPVFFMISFFLTHGMYANHDMSRAKKRVQRLLYPYLAWAVIYYVGYGLISGLLRLIGSEASLGVSYTYRDLLWQIAFGSDRWLCSQLWYQFDLIVISLLVWIIYKYLENISYYVVISLMIISIVLQYSGVNYRLFGGFEYEIRWSTGRLAEVTPFACIGIILASEETLKRISRHRLFAISFCISGIGMVALGNIFVSLPADFGYGGIYRMVYAVLSFTMFWAVPFEKTPDVIKRSLFYMAKYSFGVYCIHLGVGICWNGILCPKFGWQTNTFIECIGIYTISLLVSYGISFVPTRYARQLVE